MKLLTNEHFSLTRLNSKEIINSHERLTKTREAYDCHGSKTANHSSSTHRIHYLALDKPLSCSVMLGVTYNIMVDRGVWRSEPCWKFLSRLVPYERVSAAITNDCSIWEMTDVVFHPLLH
jgi:hypothetical protein